MADDVVRIYWTDGERDLVGVASSLGHASSLVVEWLNSETGQMRQRAHSSGGVARWGDQQVLAVPPSYVPPTSPNIVPAPPDVTKGVGDVIGKVIDLGKNALNPIGLYGELVGLSGGPQAITTGGGAGVGALISTLIRLLPAAAITVIRAANGKWANLPSWVRTLLLGLGLNEGVDIIIDDSGPAFNDLLPALLPGGGGGGGNLPVGTMPFIQAGDAYYDPQHGLIVGSWTANGTPFVKFSDGWQAAYSSKRNRWRYWKPKKPIVLYADGAKSPAEAARAFRALKAQAKALKPLVDQFSPPRRRRTARTREVRPDGTTIIRVD